MDYQVGDRVEVTHNYMGANIKGLTATVLAVRASVHGVSLEFSVPVQAEEQHTCGGRGRRGYCWNVPAKYIQPALSDIEKARTPVERKASFLWRKSSFVKKHPKFAY